MDLRSRGLRAMAPLPREPQARRRESGADSGERRFGICCLFLDLPADNVYSHLFSADIHTSRSERPDPFATSSFASPSHEKRRRHGSGPASAAPDRPHGRTPYMFHHLRCRRAAASQSWHPFRGTIPRKFQSALCCPLECHAAAPSCQRPGFRGWHIRHPGSAILPRTWLPWVAHSQ